MLIFIHDLSFFSRLEFFFEIPKMKINCINKVELSFDILSPDYLTYYLPSHITSRLPHILPHDYLPSHITSRLPQDYLPYYLSITSHITPITSPPILPLDYLIYYLPITSHITSRLPPLPITSHITFEGHDHNIFSYVFITV